MGDLRLVPAAATAWVAAALVTSTAPVAEPTGLQATGVVPLIGVLLAAGVSTWGVLAVARRCPGAARGRWLPLLGLTVVVGVATLSAAHGRLAAVAAGPVDEAAASRARATLQLRLTGDPLPRQPGPGAPSWQREQVRITAQVHEVAGIAGTRPVPTRTDTPVVVLAPMSWSDLVPGTVVRAVGRLSLPSRPGPVAAVVTVGDGPVVVGRSVHPFALADAPRRALRQAVRGLPADPAGLLPSLVVGDESLLSATLREDLRTTGLAHLTAVSGANVAIVLGAVLGLARWVGVRGRWLPAVGLASVAGFVLMARPEPSVVRASAMGVVVVLGLLTGGRRGGVGPLAVAVVVLLLADPWLARTVGFALSCAATAGIVVLARPWTRAASRWMPVPVAMALAVPLAAQLACTPLLVGMSEELSMSAVPANLLAAPAVPPATVLGIAAAVVGVGLPAVAHLLAAVAMVPTGWIVMVADRLAGLPGTVLPWAWGVPLAVVLTGALVAVMGHVLRSRLLCLGTSAALALLMVRPGLVTGWPPPGWAVAACDVGQGDALVLRADTDQAVVVDAGPDPRAADRCLDDLGVRAVPVVVISHFHADHVAGITGVGSGRPVGSVLVGPYLEPREQSEALRAWAEAAGVPVQVAKPGDRARVGQVSWTVLWPERIIGASGSTPNQASLVLRADVGGLSVLLTGDVEPEAQRALTAVPGVSLDVDVLKVPHHGSAEQDPGFLRGASPLVAVVSVGADNSYGHPGEETLRALHDLGARVLRTDHDGDVVILRPDPGAAGGVGVVRRAPRHRVRVRRTVVACSPV